MLLKMLMLILQGCLCLKLENGGIQQLERMRFLTWVVYVWQMLQIHTQVVDILFQITDT